MSLRPNTAFWTFLVAAALCGAAPDRIAAAEPAGEGESGPEFRLSSALGLRAVPVGLTLGNDLGARWGLFESESRLLEDTWIEPGITTEISPSNGWGGLYLDAVPVAVLQLHASFQSIHYFGTYGYLHVPADQSEPDWTLDAVDDRFQAGRPARGWMTTLRARPRVKLGPFVAFVDGEFRWIDMEVDGAYYESTFDVLLEPEDGYYSVVPTAGWVFEFAGTSSWLLTAGAWEHTSTLRTDLTRNMARLLLLWGVPFEVGGAAPEVAILGGHWVTHPNRAGTWYLAGQISVDWTL